MTFKKRLILYTLGIAVALFSGAFGSRLIAQANTATILGTLTDSSGAAVPGATVRVMNTGTGATEVTMSDSEGRYRVPALPIGDYEVQAEKAGS